MGADERGPRFETAKATARIDWKGDLTFDRAAELKETLLEAFGSSDRVELNLAEVTGMDASILQLLCAAHREAAALRKGLCWAGAYSAEVADAVQTAGFQRHDGCAEGCLWRGEEKCRRGEGG